MFSERASSTGVAYTGIIGLVVLTAGITAVGVGAATGGGIADVPIVGNAIADGGDDDFVVLYEDDIDQYNLVYIGDSEFDSESTDVFEVTNNDGDTVLQEPGDWDDATIENGDIVIEDLTSDTHGFTESEMIDLINHEDAFIDEGDVVSQSGGELITSVAILPPDPDEFDDDDLEGVDGSSEGSGEGGVVVE